MEISLEEKQNNIRRITNTVDFGLGMTQAVSNMEELPSRRKQEICLFKFDDLNSPTFAYRLIRDARKLREYPSCMEYRSEDIGYPTIRYFNEASSEVVTDWIVGELLGFLSTNMKITMLDTLGLSINNGRYMVFDRSVFNPTFNKIDENDKAQVIGFLKDKKGLQRYTLNPKNEQKQQGLVYPNITIFETYKRNGGYQCNLKPHISIPKMLQGQSIEEINNGHYQEAVTTLQIRLKDMGVYVYEQAIHEATVTILHYCMNILMQTEADARILLNAINKMTLGDRYENHSRDYSNKGKAVRFHTDTFELIFYLKYYDFLETGNDRIDRRRTPQERAIADKLLKTNMIPPLIRIEIRFNGKPSIRRHLKTILGTDKATWTFKEIFDEEISRKVIQFYWHKLMDNSLNKLMLSKISEEDLLLKLKGKFNTIPQRVVDNTLGMIKRLQMQGILTYKEELLQIYSRSKWYKDQKKIVDFLDENKLMTNSSLFDFMESSITKKPMQLGLPLF